MTPKITTNGKGHPSGRKKTVLGIKLDPQKTKKNGGIRVKTNHSTSFFRSL